MADFYGINKKPQQKPVQKQDDFDMADFYGVNKSK
jgi:hypothetical protein